MLESPARRQAHSLGLDQHLQRHFGLADRSRHHWSRPKAHQAVPRRLADLSHRRLPGPHLAAHFAPSEIASAHASAYPPPRALALARVQAALRPPFFTGPRS